MNFILNRKQKGPVRVMFTISQERISVESYTSGYEIHWIIRAMLAAGEKAIQNLQIGSSDSAAKEPR